MTATRTEILLRKISDRTSRKGCKSCGSTTYYWGQNDAVPSGQPGRFVMIEATDDTRPVAKMDYFPIGSELHAAYCTTKTVTPEPVTPEPVATWNDVDAPVTPEPVTVPAAPDTLTPDAGRALADLIKSLTPSAPALDVDAVRKIIAEETAKIVMPTVTVIMRENHEPVKVTGAHPMLAKVATVAGIRNGDGTRKNVMLIGPAGTGKTTMCRQIADAMGLSFGYLSLSPMTSDAKVFGFIDGGGTYHGTTFRDAWQNGGVWLADEYDLGHPGVIASLNGALASTLAPFPDGMVERHPDFVAFAASNTHGNGADRSYVARQRQDKAALNRFVPIVLNIDPTVERAMCAATGADAGTVDAVLSFANVVRQNIARHSLDAIFTPRDTEAVCQLLVAGFDWSEAVETMGRRGASDADWAKITTGARLS